MLAIKIEKDFADIPHDIQIQIKLINPVFTDSGIVEAYSYSWSLQNTPNNTLIFNKYKTSQIKISIMFCGYNIIRGVGFMKSSSDGISISLREEEYDIKKLIADLTLKSIDTLPTIQVYNEADSISTKIYKWQTLAKETAYDQNEWADVMCFPTLNQKAKDDDSNKLANIFFGGVYRFGENIDINPAYGDTPWRTSISPCLKMKFIVTEVFNYLNLKYDLKALESIDLYNQLFAFSGIFLDRLVDGPTTGKVTNVFVKDLNVNDLLPSVPMTNIFATLHDLFGAVFLFDGNELKVRLLSNILKEKHVDMSRFADPEYSASEIGEAVKFEFPIDVMEKYYQFGVGDKLSFYYQRGAVQMKPRKVGNSYSMRDYSYSCVLANSNYELFETNFNEDPDNVNFTYITSCAVNLEYSSPQLDDEINSIDQLCIGTFRGIRPLWHWFDQFNEVGEFMNSPIFSSWTSPIWVHDPIRNFVDFVEHDYSLGDHTIYPLEGDSSYNQFLKPKIDHLTQGKSIDKIMYLGLNELMNLLQWKQPNHIIKQRNMSFKGTVKEISFTLFKDRISPSVITYSCLENIDNGSDFNDDFNNDFTSE